MAESRQDQRPRAADGRAPNVFRPGEWIPMRGFGDEDEVDFAIVGTGAGGGTLACKLAEAGFTVVAFDAPASGASEGTTADIADYIDAMRKLQRIYGGFAGVVATLVFLYVSATTLIFGAEINGVLKLRSG
jgi:hypothetical protein